MSYEFHDQRKASDSYAHRSEKFTMEQVRFQMIIWHQDSATWSMLTTKCLVLANYIVSLGLDTHQSSTRSKMVCLVPNRTRVGQFIHKRRFDMINRP